MPNESLALRLFISTLSSSKDFRFTEYWQGAQLSVFQLLVWEQPEQRTGADPHRFPPFYGNRSDMFLKVGWVWSEKTSKLKCCSRHIQHRTWKLTLMIVRWFARLHPWRMELVNILSEWLRTPGKGNLGSSNLKNSPGKLAPSVLVLEIGQYVS